MDWKENIFGLLAKVVAGTAVELAAAVAGRGGKPTNHRQDKNPHLPETDGVNVPP